VTKDDFYGDDGARKPKTRTRKRGRLKRASTCFLLFMAFVVVLVIAAPTIICQSPLAKSTIASTLDGYGFEGGFDSIRIGWLTPLRVEGLNLTGKTAGSKIRVDLVETDLTILKCIGGLSDLGEIAIRGVVMDVSVRDGKSSVEDDIASLMESESPASDGDDDASVAASPIRAKISAKDVSVRITDAVTGSQWIADQSKADVALDADNLDMTFSTVLTDPVGGSGEMQGRIEYPMIADKAYKISVVTQRIPLSLASIAKRWLGESGASIPSEIGGDTTGSISLSGGIGDTLNVSVSPIEFRNFIASDPSMGQRVWRNGLTAINGSVTLEGTRILGRDLVLTTDFGSASFNGAFQSSISLSGETNPAAWLEALDGAAGVSIDLVAFEKSLPGLIPLRDQVEITAGSFSAEVTSAVDAGSTRRSHWNLKTQPIRAIASGRAVVIEPATLVASLRVNQGQFAADSLRLQSAFANATADGDLSHGRVKGDIQFSRLASMIQPLLEMPELSLVGQATGEVNWAAEAGDVWKLGGKAEASDLVITLPGGINFQQSSLRGDVGASGRWSGGELQELNSLELRLSTSGLEASAGLIAPVAKPSTTIPLPLKLAARGRVEAVAGILSPWMPTSIQTLEGGFTANALANVAATSGEITVAKMQLDEPRLGYADQLYAQPQLLIDFDGRYEWPKGNLAANKLSVVGDALSAAVQGKMDASGINFEVAWRAKLDRLQGAMRPNVLLSNGTNSQINGLPGDAKPVAFRAASPAATPSYQAVGDCEGRFTISQQENSSLLLLDAQTIGNTVQIFSPPSSTPTPTQKTQTTKPLWAERLVNLDTKLSYDTTDGKLNAEKLLLTTDWFATTLAGTALWNEAIGDVAMKGTARIKMPEVASQLTTMLGMKVNLQGVHETPVDIDVKRNGSDAMTMLLKANIGWESGEVAGIKFGSTAIPVTMNETTVSVQPATIPVEQGRLQLAGDLFYAASPMMLQVRPGMIAENLKLTPELTNQWLQYVAPMVANSTRVAGSFGIELAEANVNLENTMASKVRGTLRIQNVDLDSGPVANQIISSVKQIQQLARGLNAEPVAERDRRLVTFPTQSVGFEFADGVVSHERMTMEVDRAKIITGGQVNVDGRINLVAQLPLEASWLGSDLKSLAGKNVTLPIAGTLSRPTLDSAAIGRLVAEMGTKALQKNAESYIEKQLGKGLEKLLGR